MQGEKHFLAVLLFKSVGFVLFFVVVVLYFIYAVVNIVIAYLLTRAYGLTHT